MMGNVRAMGEGSKRRFQRRVSRGAAEDTEFSKSGLPQKAGPTKARAGRLEAGATRTFLWGLGWDKMAGEG
jgi:hypothetical protein